MLVDETSNDERARLGELLRLSVLDTPDDPELDVIVDAAAEVFGAPIALVSLIDEGRQWFKAVHGVVERETPRDFAFCAHTIRDPGDAMVVEDASRDERFASNPLVVGEPKIRFYAGAPLVTSRGYTVGTLCVIDRDPRVATSEQVSALKALGALAMRRIESRLDDGSAWRLAARRSRPSNSLAAFEWDERGLVTSWTVAAERLFGWSATEAIGALPPMLAPGDTAAYVLRCERALCNRGDGPQTTRMSTKSGRTVSVALDMICFTKPHGRRSGLAVIEDVGARLAIHSRQAGYVLDDTPAVDMSADERNRVLELAVCGAPLEAQLGCIVMLMKGVIPSTMGTIMLLKDGALTLAAADSAMPKEFLEAIEGVAIGPAVGSCGTAAYCGENVMCGDIATDARWLDYRDLALSAGLRSCWSIPLRASDHTILGAFALYGCDTRLPSARQLQLFEETVAFAAIVLDRHRDQERLREMALYDALTGLPNRYLFERRLSSAFCTRGGHIGVGLIDINRFKSINDAFGHDVGDALLRAIAGRLAPLMRENDTLARMAGDEFSFVLPDLASHSEGISSATRLLDAFATAFEIEGSALYVRPSIGLAFYPEITQDTAVILRAADEAMYAAKLRGGGLELAKKQTAEATTKRFDLENDLRRALERGELALHYQMIFEIESGRPKGTEGLLRWNHPRFGMILPGEFISIAEANGSIVAIGAWVIAEAARTAARWHRDGHAAFVAVNVSALQFDASGLVESVMSALEDTGLDPDYLHLELTESLIMRNPRVAAATILQLKALGVRIVIDDFGTGYSSLAYLQQFTFDTLKIDRAFVGGISDDTSSARSESIVRAVVDLSSGLGVTTIAEGVETAKQLAFVTACGCEFVQGFLTARPVAAEALRWDARVPRPITPASFAPAARTVPSKPARRRSTMAT